MTAARGTALVLLAAGALAGCGSSSPAANPSKTGSAMVLKSLAFVDGAAIPARYTCDGQNVSPALLWSTVPVGTKALALTVQDADASNFLHWAVVDLERHVGGLLVGAHPRHGAFVGRNDAGGVGYTGPCPPRGATAHHYHFVIYALRARLAVSPGFRYSDVADQLARDTIGVGQLVGTYRR